MTLEQLREQCAKIAYLYADSAFTHGSHTIAIEIFKSIQSISLPNTPDYEKQIAELKESLRYVVSELNELESLVGCNLNSKMLDLARERAK